MNLRELCELQFRLRRETHKIGITAMEVNEANSGFKSLQSIFSFLDPHDSLGGV